MRFSFNIFLITVYEVHGKVKSHGKRLNEMKQIDFISIEMKNEEEHHNGKVNVDDDIDERMKM